MSSESNCNFILVTKLCIAPYCMGLYQKGCLVTSTISLISHLRDCSMWEKGMSYLSGKGSYL